MRNPFHPTFGTAPPILIGRDDALLAFDQGVTEGPGSPWRAIKVSGPRGVGKTALLSAFGQRETVREWVHVDATVGPEMLEDIWDQARIAVARHTHGARSRRVTGASVSVLGIGGSITTESDVVSPLGWRARMETLFDALEEHARGAEVGVVFTIDEVHAGVPELEQFAKAFQHFVRAGRNVMVVFAGLPREMVQTQKTPGLTFVWRAESIDLGSVPVVQVLAAFERTVTDNGRSIAPEVLRAMARATEGFPFLVQLVGYHVWNECRTDEIVLDDVRRGVEIARRKLGTTVHALSIRDLSEKDRAFLVGMTVDDGPSRLSDVASRMGATAKFASVYRARLIESGMVEPAGHGLVTFAPPYLRDYLREHQDTLVG